MEEKNLSEMEYDVNFLELEEVKHKASKRQAIVLKEMKEEEHETL